MIVTGHQINLLPGISVLEKIRSADAVIWMDGFQYERHGFVNRNRLSVDGSWLTIPVNEHDTFRPINQVRIADATMRARAKVARTLEHFLGRDAAAPFVAHLERPYRRLVELNYQLIQILLQALEIDVEQHFQSMLEAGGMTDLVVSDDEEALVPARERLAGMVAELGADVWLSGPSGSSYLSEAPFVRQGIEVRYFPSMGPNASAITLLRDRTAA